MTNDEKLLQNIDKRYLSQWQDIGKENKELKALLNELASSIESIKNLNNEKKILSAQIGKLKKAGDNADSVIAEQQQLKDSISKQKASKIHVIENIKQFFDANSRELPPRYQTSQSASNDSIGNISIRYTQEITAEKINQYLDSHQNSTPYHYPCWQSLFKKIFNQDDVSLVALNETNEVVGLLPLTLFSSSLFGKFIVSIPYFNYGGPITNNSEIERLLLEKAIEISAEHESEHLELRELGARDSFQNKQEKVSMIRTLPSLTEQFSVEIDTKLRAQINRSKEFNPEFTVGRYDLLDDYYKVFAHNMRDLGTPVYSKEFFKGVLDTWPETNLVVVYLRGKPVSCAFLLGYREVLEIPWASALKRTNSIGINMYMYYCILNFAIEKKYKYFDFGRSSKDSGTYRFKQQWGAKPVQNYWNYWLPEGKDLPQINPNNPKYKLFIEAWKKTPTIITNLVGPHIVKNIP